MKPIRPIHDKNLSNLRDVHDRVHTILDGNVSLGAVSNLGAAASQSVEQKGNLDVAHAGATAPGVANTDFAVTHNLNRVPSGFIVTNSSAPCHVYGGGTPWTATQIFVKCDVINVLLNFMIF